MNGNSEKGAREQHETITAHEDRASYADGARFLNGKLAHADLTFDLRRARAESSVMTIEQFWKKIGSQKADLQIEITPDEPPAMVQMGQQLMAFFRRKIIETVSDMRGDINMSRAIAHHAAMAQFAPGSSNAVDHIEDFLQDGVLVALSIIEVGIKAFLYDDHRDLDKIPSQEIAASLRSPKFTGLIAAMGYGSAAAESAFLEALRIDRQNYGKFMMDTLDPYGFEVMTSTDGTKYLKTKDTVMEDIKRLYGIISRQRGEYLVNQCPAGFVKGEKETVLKEFIAWLIELSIQHYIPAQYPRLGKGL